MFGIRRREFVKRIVSGTVLAFLLISMSMFVFNVQPINTSETIYIRANGSIDPPTAPISTVDNVTYVFTDHINEEVVIERNDIIVDGAWYTVQSSECGFNLTSVQNVTIRNTKINQCSYGVYIDASSFVNISNNTINNTSSGVRLTWSSKNNTISKNNITNCNTGIAFGHSAQYNTVTQNNITNNTQGVSLLRSSYQTFRGNSFSNNTYHLGIRGWDLYEFVNDVDTSNTVDGKPVYYWINQRDFTVPLDAGYVVLVNCSRISAQNLTLTNNGEAILVAYTSNSTISRNNVAYTDYGIYLHSATNNTVSENNITKNNRGIYVYWFSAKNTISTNNVSENTYGVYVSKSSNNTIVDNTMDSNTHTSIWLRYSSTDNMISRNNISKGIRGIELWQSSNNSVCDNSISAISSTGILLGHSYSYPTSQNSVTGNNISDAYWGIIVSSSSNCSLSNNYVVDTYWGVQLHESSNCTLSQNNLFVNYNYGVDLSNSSWCRISRNNITNGDYGVYLTQSTNNSISQNNITSNWHGIYLDDSSSSNNVSENIIDDNSGYGLYVNHSHANVITENVITRNQFGIYFDHQSENNTISENNITRNDYGVHLYRFSDRNTFSGNNLTDNEWGAIGLYFSSNSLLRNNHMTGSWRNLVLVGSSIEDYIHDIDSSNTVDGKPVYYWINRRDDSVPLNAGFVALVNSVNITVEELELVSNGDGILLVNTSRSIIADNKIGDTGSGIRLWKSSLNSIQRNNISSSHSGLLIDESLLNTVSANTIANCRYGVYLYRYSNNNTISRNAIVGSGVCGIYLWTYCNNNTFYENHIRDSIENGVRLYRSSFNLFYHNSFLNNTQQAVIDPPVYSNTWDSGYPSAGNHWGDYTGVDKYRGSFQNETDSDGIGDTPYIIDANNTDNYPLMKPYGGPHDIGITGLNISKAVVGENCSLHVTLRILNYGAQPETFNVTIKANSTAIHTEAVMLANRNSTTVTFAWNTTDLAKGNYTISAYADPVLGETDTTDNSLTDGWIIIAMIGDITGPDGWPDGKVDIRDVAAVAILYGVDYPDPRFSPNCDINNDLKIDIKDVATVAIHYGEIDP